MIKYGYLVFSLLEIVTLVVAIIAIIVVFISIIREYNIFDLLGALPTCAMLCNIITTSFVLIFAYVVLHFNDQFNHAQLKKCCNSI